MNKILVGYYENAFKILVSLCYTGIHSPPYTYRFAVHPGKRLMHELGTQSAVRLQDLIARVSESLISALSLSNML